MTENKELIVITGYGSISPLGFEKEKIWKNYLSGKSFIRNVLFNKKLYPVGALNEDAENKIKDFIEKNIKLKRLDRTALMALTTAQEAFEDAGWNNEKNISAGVTIGSSRGATGMWEEYHEQFLQTGKTHLLTSPLTTLGNISSSVANYLSVEGPVISHSVTCSTAIQSIANSVAWLKAGMADKFLAGGSEAPLTKFTLAQLESLGIYSEFLNDKFPCRPLELKSNSMVLGEGAAVFAVEKIKKEEIKSEKIYAVIESAGFGFEKNPSATGISPNGENFQKAMRTAIKGCDDESEVDLILMHAPGTIAGDKAELTAIKEVFKNKIPDLYSNKFNIGHTYAASAALSMELALMIFQKQIIPDIPYKTDIRNTKKEITKIMINAAGFGGNAASLILSAGSFLK
ncbi:MAG: beta-ketoacyl synthase N-terminal-like domain-containing protein [Bacteroidales bacterium]|nr:beta-ketoacyl synthase N-terminal-like domain-containing protein [Bacteroidales bacterium]